MQRNAAQPFLRGAQLGESDEQSDLQDDRHDHRPA
jgi:hypothetical protein